MNHTFFHHIMCADAEAGSRAGPVRLATTSKAITDVVGLQRVLKMACHHEVALTPPVDTLFEQNRGNAKQRAKFWSAIKDAGNLRWILPVRKPANVTPRSLPEDWLAKGYRNVCFGAVIDDAATAADVLAQLSKIPCSLRMALVLAEELPDLCEHLAEVNWVVYGAPGEPANDTVMMLKDACRRSGTSYFDSSTEALDASVGPDANGPEGLFIFSPHPFGEAIDLQRPSKYPRSGNPPPSGKLIAEWFSGTRAPAPAPVADSTGEGDEDATKASPTTAPGVTDGTGTQSTVPCNSIVLAEVDEILPGSSAEANSDFVRLDSIIRSSIAAFKECGFALSEVRERKLWAKGGFSTWEAYLRDVAGMTRTYAYRLIVASRVAAELEALPNGNIPLGVLPASESQVRPLQRLKDPAKRTEAWSQAVERSNGQPTAQTVSAIVAELMAKKPMASARRSRCPAKVKTAFRLLEQAVNRNQPADQVGLLLKELGKVLNLPTPAG